MTEKHNTAASTDVAVSLDYVDFEAGAGEHRWSSEVFPSKHLDGSLLLPDNRQSQEAGESDLARDLEKTVSKGGGNVNGVLNRSHDSIESQRTIIEADDFASYLAQDDGVDVDDFVDEGEDVEVDLSVLMKGGHNPYMLDFTSSAFVDSEGGDDYDDEDCTLSDSEWDAVAGDNGMKPGVHNDAVGIRDVNGRSNKPWTNKAETIQKSGGEKDQEKKPEEDEEFESPPRNLREEINNNVNKFSRLPPVMSPVLFHTASHEGSYFSYVPDSEAGHKILPKYYIRSNSNTPPSSPQTHKPQQTSMTGSHVFSTSGTEQLSSKELVHGFDPYTQSSPKLKRPNQADFFNYESGHCDVGRFQNVASYASADVQSPHRSRHKSFDNSYISQPASPQPPLPPPHRQSYTVETPLGRSAFISSSLENLTTSNSPDRHLFPKSVSVNCEFDSCAPENSWPMSRGKSLPDIANLAPGTYQDICKNCSFSRNDYLFKIGLLQTQLEKTEKDLKRKEKQWAGDLGELRKENERQQKVINQSLTLGPEAKIEATMQHEITRLTSENLDLRESIDKQTDQIRKLKKMLKVYARKLKDGEAAEIAAELESEESAANTGNIATVIHRERSYMGMLEYKKEDEAALVKNLILDLKPKLAAGLIPGLPAYVLFMSVRHTDYVNDDEKVKSLLTSTINGIKKVVKRHSDDLERITMWLANTCRLLHTLKQYSGEKQFQTENTGKQNEQSLRNFDLSEYRQVFSDLAVWNYQALMKLMEELIQPNIVPAILEHEAIAGLTASKPSGLRGRSSSNARDIDDGKDNQHSLDALMRTLNSYMRIIKQHAVDPELVKQIFRQLFYFLCAGALNNLLLRKDMCNWSKGMQIRYNLSHLEQWLRDNSLHEFGAQAALEPIIQASQLLQARKTESDVDSICDMCSKLTTAQIVKILNIYTPVDEFEERVPITFIRKIQAKLKKGEDPGAATNTLLMDTKYSYPVTFPFNPSAVALETISVPDQLHLGFLVRH